MDELYVNLDLENGVKMDIALKLNELSMLTGMNNVGKSLILKLSWFSNFVLQYAKIALPTMTEDEVKEEMSTYVQICFPLTFTNPEEFSGHMQIKREGEYVFQLSFTKGELVWHNIEIINRGSFSIMEIQQIKFASKNTRTFIEFKRYLELIKLLDFDIKYAELGSSKLKKLCSFYPLYDIMWFEDIKIKNKRLCEDFSLVPNTAIKLIQETTIEKDFIITGLVLDQLGLPSFVNEVGVKRALDNYGTGTQSMIMLIMYATI